MKRALLLGIAPNPEVISPDRWETESAFTAAVPGSGRWLREVLNSPKLKGWVFTLENAVTFHRVENLLPQFDKVIALSRIVSVAYDLPYVPHPAFWKRFKHSREDYVKKIQRVLEAA